MAFTNETKSSSSFTNEPKTRPGALFDVATFDFSVFDKDFSGDVWINETKN